MPNYDDQCRRKSNRVRAILKLNAPESAIIEIKIFQMAYKLEIPPRHHISHLSQSAGSLIDLN